MAGPITRGEQRVPWATRTDASVPRRSTTQPQDSPSAVRHDKELLYFSPSEHRYGGSPSAMSPETSTTGPPPSSSRGLNALSERASAPAEMFQPHRNLSMVGAERGQTTLSADPQGIRPAAPVIASASRSRALSQPEDIKLDPTAPIRAIRNPTPAETRKSEDSTLGTVAEEDERPLAETPRDKDKGKGVAPAGEPSAAQPPQEDGPVWGEPFKVEWIRSHRLPFTRTRHLRNPWNHDREVKVSRDGTELEPAVGQLLLEEWDKVEQPQTQPPTPGATVDVGRRLHGKASISVDVLPGATPGPREGR
ncbi:hypothetical protein TRAPUB_8278 [Trametes pubescens]|uniref:YTH domain-containing protein n=1 Tax=Trametes pubescens TaxID=154538 RepID=A0A1M2W5M7_TRAPU|nr:hypothetical protein TRAPUB_8278 [Trametes pubescens]